MFPTYLKCLRTSITHLLQGSLCCPVPVFLFSRVHYVLFSYFQTHLYATHSTGSHDGNNTEGCLNFGFFHVYNFIFSCLHLFRMFVFSYFTSLDVHNFTVSISRRVLTWKRNSTFENEFVSNGIYPICNIQKSASLQRELEGRVWEMETPKTMHGEVFHFVFWWDHLRGVCLWLDRSRILFWELWRN